MDPATTALMDRMNDSQRVTDKVLLSVLLHVGLVALFGFAGFHSPQARTDLPVMSISLGGAPGPRDGGMTPLSGRATQQAVPLPVTRPQAVRPPAASPAEMAISTKITTKPTPKPSPVPSVDQAKGRTPTVGKEVTQGTAIAQTGAQGMGLGLSTGGGGTGGEINLADFCCPEYLSTMIQLIQRNWTSKQEVPGVTVMEFTVRRDGKLTDVTMLKTSGFVALDMTSQRALLLTNQLPPLPAAFTGPQLVVRLEFQYQRR